ncbi:MAG: LysR family transcriptional regulator [Hydrogenophaga sp.]|uniref:LysR substrate-binding domain-containing protein n=1 Tax=Hydrogenophaga sp. TaxID=1904254 RepID=UPI0016B94788|nr:LysR substrate-binding domain-containing protein [Hydrogenophaga sp.]NIM41447.1 LysR family transcriptional regulator [Hydrogenophaga sp.]NIN26763.1 LysR family transcriptional regulator [Hydrogenophaga sp.]NIN31462.1 LysR family transcriptional regulator [Hydrogenophaga sp.]NIN55693.1 LysR family transcriptional regulator [Hydrogenophaga sp.]NIO51856.1 LysR family transcriptional regulator [Hydrogenophaga sp.]
MNLNDLTLFAQAVESGGFAPAARRFSVPKSTLSKRVAALEASLGVRLIERSSRSFRLTDTGHDFYQHARAALVEVESAQQVVQSRLAEPSGTVRLTAAVPVVQFQLAPHLPALARTWPRLQLQLHASDRFVDLVQEGYDIALRSHFAPLPDSGLVQRTLMVEPVMLVAAPAYLREHGVPRQPADLAAHHGLLTAADATRWTLSKDKGDTVQTIEPRPRLVANESVALLHAATAGLGIVCLPETICQHHVARGELVRVLPHWTAGRVTTTALVPHRRSLLPSVRAVLDFLSAQLG